MNLDPNSLVASLLVSGVGFVLWSYGKKQRRMPHAVVGVVMLLYPYAVSDVGLMLGIGAGLCALLWGVTFLGL